MPQDDETTAADVAASFDRLKESAASLNKAADGLGRVVTDVEYAFKRLNLGVSAWVEIDRQVANGGEFWIHEVGYDRIGTKWGLAVRTIEGYDHQDPNEWRTQEYPFHESPRRFRIGAVTKLPKLLDALARMAELTAKDLTQEIAYAQQFVTALNNRPHTAQQQAAALKQGAQPTTTELQLEALRGRAAQPATSAPPPKSAKEAVARAAQRVKEREELNRKAQRQGAIEALKKL